MQVRLVIVYSLESSGGPASLEIFVAIIQELRSC